MLSEVLSPRERAAVLWAEHVTKNTARSRDDVYALVREQFSEEEVIELTMMSAFFNLFNRVTDSLRVPIEMPDEVDLIKRSVRLEPEKVKSYLETMVRDWPAEIPEPNPD